MTLAAAVSGCLVDVDYGGTRFRCAVNDVCPDDLVCHEGQCIRPEDIPDDAGAAALRHTLTVSGSVTGTLSDAPVLVTLTPERIDYGRTDGSDLRFTASDGAPLAHEIETWNQGGTSAVWVKLPSLATGTSFAMIYGDGVAQSQQATEVWTAYDLVYHLALDGAESRLGFNATGRNGVTHGAGRIGGAGIFDGVDDFYEIGEDLPLMRSAPAGTLEGWVRLDTAGAGGSLLEIATNGSNGSRMFGNLQVSGVMRLGIRTQDMATAQNADGLDAVTVGEWAWLVGVADFASQTTVIYFNGVESSRTEGLLFDPMTPDTNSDVAVIGADDGLAAGGFFPGGLDEIRCAPTAVTAEWVAAQYLSMTDALLDYGAAEEP